MHKAGTAANTAMRKSFMHDSGVALDETRKAAGQALNAC
jgi:hypothetical protein